MTRHKIIIQFAEDNQSTPNAVLLKSWVKSALQSYKKNAQVTIRIVSSEESAQLNEQYRHKKGPTNVLSFPYELPDGIKMTTPLLGDIAICANVVNKEAEEQNKNQKAHWAHIVIHGVLHLLGYNHIEEQEAIEMESLEIKILHNLGFQNPYIIGED